MFKVHIIGIIIDKTTVTIYVHTCIFTCEVQLSLIRYAIGGILSHEKMNKNSIFRSKQGGNWAWGMVIEKRNHRK